MKGRSGAKAAERIPPVLEGLDGSLWGVVLVLAIVGSPGVVWGNATGRPVVVFCSSFVGSLLALAYFLYKPFNFFSDNIYAPKHFRKLNEGELRALGYMNSRRGRLVTLAVAAGSALLPLLGHLICVAGMWCLEKGGRQGDDLEVIILLSMFCGALAGVCGYMTLIPYVLWRRWNWIQEHQPLPDAKVLAKYAKGSQVGKWDHLYGTEFSEEMDRALEGRPGRGFWRVMLRLLGGGVAALTAFRLLSGDVVEELRLEAVVVLVVGVLIYWLAGRYLGGSESEED
ncbi:MAG TPA: hypothetical protein P5568_13340 [Acidobacteriota bacterium]|nr:hypothetical protein [Acidobacteriota bacterium]